MSDWHEPSNDAGRDGPSMRAERLLVRVLLSLRSEARRSTDPCHDHQRAEALANRIMAEFPRRVLPVGLAAMLVVVLYTSFPLVRDMLPDAAGGAQSTPVATAVETGLRQQGSAMSDGIEALRAIVGPFSAPSTTPTHEHASPSSADDAVHEHSEAAAPFQKS
ncbi:MAG: hypothetical protein RL591_565 [Planctomycetota bacterium]|jgi:hypothetical protein